MMASRTGYLKMQKKPNKKENPLQKKIEALRCGKELPLNVRDVLMSVEPDPPERAVLGLARALQYKSDPDSYMTTLVFVEEAVAYYNANGLGATLDRMFELEDKN